jgi:hypothetical protein
VSLIGRPRTISEWWRAAPRHVFVAIAAGPHRVFSRRPVSLVAPRLHRKRINISTVQAGQKLGIKEVDGRIWLAKLHPRDLGYFDLEQKTLQPLDNPFGTRLSPMS